MTTMSVAAPTLLHSHHFISFAKRNSDTIVVEERGIAKRSQKETSAKRMRKHSVPLAQVLKLAKNITVCI